MQPAAYQPLDAFFYDLVVAATESRQKSVVQYFGEFREFSTASGIINRVEGEWAEMASGQRIRLDRIISLNGQFFPGYDDYAEAIGARCSL